MYKRLTTSREFTAEEVRKAHEKFLSVSEDCTLFDVYVDTDTWIIGFGHITNAVNKRKETHLHLLCFTFRWQHKVKPYLYADDWNK